MESILKRVIQDKTLYIKITWKDDGTDLFHIKLITNELSWSGRYSTEVAIINSDKVDETLEEYKANVKKALTEHSNDYIYQFTNDPNDINGTFTWKKMYEKPIVHGSVAVHLDDVPETTSHLVDHLLNANNQLQQSIHDSTQRVETLMAELKKCHEEMDRFISMKTSLEVSLYEKFVHLLNTKKRRIALLEEHIGEAAAAALLNE